VAPALATHHDVVLLPSAVSLAPAAVPPAAQPGGGGVPPGASVLPPTRTLHVGAVVANQGNVAEQHVVVTASLTPVPTGTVRAVSVTTSLAVGGSVAVQLPSLPVRSDHEYTLTVSVRPPAGQTATAGLAQTSVIWVAPST
jgi:hypothetical protein